MFRRDSASTSPSPRSRWHRRRDRVAAGLLAACCLVTGLLVWTYSDARGTTSRTAPAAPEPTGTQQVPTTLRPAWRAQSPETPEPVTFGSTVITANDGAVQGRDARDGEVRWQYTRDRRLCTVGAAWSKVLTVYRKGDWCSEVTQLDPATGQRAAQRNSNAPLGTRLVTDCHYPTLELPAADTTPTVNTTKRCGYVTTTGERLLNTWRDDLVRTAEYGKVPVLVQPGKQPRPDCEHGTVASAAGRVGVIERCPDDSHDRLTVYEAVPENADEPEVVFSTELDDSAAMLVAMSEEAVAVTMPDTGSLLRFDMDGNKLQSYEVNTPRATLERHPRNGVVPTSRGTEGVYWYTGDSTVALSVDDLTPRWTLPDTLGAGTMFAGQYVVPVTNGLAVLDQDSGDTIRTVAVNRGAHTGPVTLSANGSVLVEKRADTVVALR